LISYSDVHPATARPPWQSQLRRLAPAAAIILPLGLFIYRFDPGRSQWLVDGLWLLAMGLWALAISRRSRARILSARRTDVVAVGGLLVVFCAAWLPFWANWRWAYTGDSLDLYVVGWAAATKGLHQNLLSVHGLGNGFTYLWSLALNALMFVFGPTFFWHRATQMVVCCFSLTAIYAFYTLVLGRPWGAAIVVATATNYVFLWFSYVSYGKADSYLFYFLTLTFATLCWRHPDRLRAWLWCGLVAGLSLFFTPTAWSAVMAAGAVIGIFALATRRVVAATVCAVSFLLAATPILLQFPDFLAMARSQSRSIYQWSYLVRMFTTILRLPYESPTYHIGVYGAFLRRPLGALYIAGTMISALAALPPLRRALRIPPAAPVLLGLLLWDAALMSLTNNGYGSPSTKRTYNLIPLQIFFAFLPMYIGYAWVASWKWARRVGATAVGAVVAVYAVGNFLLIAHPARGVYGINVFDGLIALRQRFPERHVLLLATREVYAKAITPESIFQQAYRLLDRVEIVADFSDAQVRRACGAQMLICYEPNMDAARFAPLLAKYKAMLKPFPLLNSVEMVCYDCVEAVAPQGSTAAK
jgi:hypothetical protein